MIRDAERGDFPAILALNAESVDFLSALSAERLADLHARCAWHRVVEVGGRVVAFLLVFREGADYDSPNYRWFDARYPQFLYVDRIVVDPVMRGHGLGARLYDELFDIARATGVALVTCEFDISPPNPKSARFHASRCFAEVGTQSLAGGKRVSLQVREVRPA